MKYRVLKSILNLKPGDILSQSDSGSYYITVIYYKTENRQTSTAFAIAPNAYPDTFTPISEKEEQIEEAKKLLEDEGFRVVEANFYSQLSHSAVQSKPKIMFVCVNCGSSGYKSLEEKHYCQ